MNHQYGLRDVCVFTNRVVSGVTSNDGEHCRITRLKPEREWHQGETEYAIEFLDEHGHGIRQGFGCRECEFQKV